MPSLLDTVKAKFLEAIRSVNPPGRWKILVVDEFTQKLLSTVLKQFDILEENVTLIESITNYREPQPEFEAMYILMPTNQNVDRIIRDFTEKKQYAAAHLFFIEALAEPLFQRLTSSPAEPHLQALKELFVNFWAIEAQVFTINEPSFFFSMYSPPRSEGAFRGAKDRLLEDMRFTSKMITNVCITLNEFPYVRYYMPANHLPLGPLKPHTSMRPPPPTENSARWRTNLARGADARAFEAVETEFVTKVLAFMVQSNLDEHKRANPDFGKGDVGRPRATLIITDRSMDMIAPFVHEFTYQAMANDLLPIDNGTKFTYKFQSSVGTYEDKTATLSDQDKLWTELRHMHMREAIDKIMSDFNKFTEEHAVFKGEGAASLNDMKDMLASLPQYQEQREAFSLHTTMAQECMALFEQAKLPQVGNVEQCCATGLTAEGKTPKNLVEEMVPLLDSRDIINTNKVRVIALYIQHRDGVPDEDRRRLYQHARLTMAEQDAVNALVQLGVKISKGPNDKDTKKKIKQKPSTEEEYELSRFKPALRTIIEDNVANKLDELLFPYVKESPLKTAAPQALRSPPPTSLRSSKPSWHKAPKPGAGVKDDKQRLIVFIAGGMSYSEIREAYQLSASLNKDIFIGSTHTITPKQFIDDLKVLDLAGVGSKAMPNGLRDVREGQRSYQEYFDDKYYLQDAPRPQPRQQPSNLSVPKQSHKIIQPSPTHSFSSSISEPPQEKEKKKKRGLFRF
ncbi:Sec1-like snare protein [Macrolepiota fuliginosa MF-IS2]|uniref:Sec1-like snare protein n=1 Tax=Macrolepiota fuliginosa MF-IS2 TaxID=1400762 RepID=A0A9P5XNW2_9AGAR|nr:Sec1-like snare protein [Macrolepiota fuliginosa MF-IS2]